jgi:hypothetical protein
MINFSPEQWLCLGIGIVLFPDGICVLKKSMAVKEMKSFDFVNRGGSIVVLIMAVFCVTFPFLPKRHSLTASLVCLALMLINGLYWFIRRVTYDLKEIRRNRQAQANKNGAQQGGPGYPPQGVGSPEP